MDRFGIPFVLDGLDLKKKLTRYVIDNGDENKKINKWTHKNHYLR